MTEHLTDEFNKLDACIHCGMCLPTCPTFRVTGSEAESPRGRLFLMRQFVEGQLDSPKQLAAHLDPCLGCLACVTACPSGVEYNTVLAASRERLVQHQNPVKRGFRRLMLRHVLPNPFLLYLIKVMTRVYEQSGLQQLVRRHHLEKLAGPMGQLEQFLPTLQPGAPLKTGQVFGENRKGRVALFVGCIMNAAYAQTHQATIKVLIANGYQVFIPKQTCCGALAHHSGEMDIASALARQNIDDILAENPDWIVVNAAGCGSTLKEYDHILKNHPQAAVFAEKTIDVIALLAKHPLEGAMHTLNLTVTYHAACHLHHAQAVHHEPYLVLSQLPGIQLVPLTEAEMCCGSAGVYNLAHPELSLRILEDKMDHVKNTGAEVVLAANPGCMLQLETGIRQAGLDMKVMHPMDLLALAYAD